MSAPKPIPVEGDGKAVSVWFERAGFTKRPKTALRDDRRRRNKVARLARRRNRA